MNNNKAEVWSQIQVALSNMNGLEIIAVISALLYVILAARKSLMCWPAAIISSICYGLLFSQAKLYSESLLQVFYLAMAVYGWLNWRKNLNSDEELLIQEWSVKSHFLNISLSLLVSLFIGYLFSRTEASYPYIDAFTTIFAVSATFMVVKRVLSNWLYWIVIDAVGVGLFAAKGLYLTSALFILYVVIAVIGYMKWKNSKAKQIVNG